MHDLSHVIELDDVQVKENLTHETFPLRINERRVKHLRGREIPLVKVVWRNASGKDATCELENQMCDAYPTFLLLVNFGDKTSFKDGRFAIPCFS